MNMSPDHVDPRLTRLAFPLNAFACAMLLEERKVEYLHYGLFKSAHESIQVAQQRSTELILDRLPKPGNRLLEIGVGLGVTARKLAEVGCVVTGISPDDAQVSLARENAGPTASLQVTTFENYRVSRGAFDVIVAQESSQYIDPKVLFAKARAALAREGALLIVDQVALRRVADEGRSLHLDAEFKEHARNNGFNLTEYADLTKQAIPTLDYILRILAHHKKRLQDLLQTDASALEELVAAVAANRRRYHEGILGYALYHFRV